MIRVKDASFYYGHNLVLDSVTLDIQSSDFLAVIGPNGSGKTTLLKIILGLLKPAQGSIQLFGTPLEEFSQWHRLGYVPQKATHFDPFFPISVREVVSLGLCAGRTGGSPSRGDDDLIVRALKSVDLEGLKGRRIGSLSNGQQQRAFIARAIVNSPEVLFLDEPTTGVDAQTQEMFYEMLDRLHREHGITIVMVTHEIGIINKHFSQVACLNQKLVYHGSHSDFCQSEAFKNMISDGHHVISHRH